MSLKQGLALGACISLLAGCGAESGTGTAASGSSVQTYTISFVDLDSKTYSNSDSCQFFGFDDPTSKSYSIIGYASKPENNYAIVIHDNDGGFVKRYTNDDWGTSATSVTISQSIVPDNGYVSFVKIETSGGDVGYDITTVSKSLLPDTFSIYAPNKDSNTSCITATNPSTTSYDVNIRTVSGYHYYGVNFINQDTSNITSSFYSTEGDTIPTFSSPTGKAVMAAQYTQNGSQIGEIESYKFLNTSALNNETSISLTSVTDSSVPWYVPTFDLTLSDAAIYVYGNTTGAYLWQPLDTSTDSTYGYSSDISSSNYYVYLSGSQQLQTFNWNIQAEIQTDLTSALSVSDFTGDYPDAETPAVVSSCSTSDSGLCIQVSTDTSKSPSSTIQRIAFKSDIDSNTSLQQVIYSDYAYNQPLMTFSDSTDTTLSSLNSISSISSSDVSLLSTDSSSLKEAFLFQHQTLYSTITDPSAASTADIDTVPLLQSYSSILEHDDLFKRTAYIWLSHTFN